MSLHRCPVCRRPVWKRRTLCMDCEKTYKKTKKKVFGGYASPIMYSGIQERRWS